MAAATFANWWGFNMLPSNDGHADDTPPGSGDPITRWGFTLPTWQTARHWIGSRDMTLATFMTQTQADMGDLALSFFWKRLGGDDLDPGVDASVIDWCWTSGGAIRDIQQNLLMAPRDIDGIIGPFTIGAINAYPTFIADVCTWRMEYYDDSGFHTEYPGLYQRAIAIKNLSEVWASNA